MSYAENNRQVVSRWCGIAEYTGTHYHGWQIQKELSVKTIQGEMQAALSKVANAPIAITGAGRTDAGVHAWYQVFHFDTGVIRTVKQWKNGVNRYLPKDIALKEIKMLDPSFHARYSATSRTYKYVVSANGLKKGLWADFFFPLPLFLDDLDVFKMTLAIKSLKGMQNFSAFRSSECQAKSPHRFIFESTIEVKSHFIIITLKANSFLHHMVRNIVGTLLEVGMGVRTLESFKRLLYQDQKRCFAGKTISSQGLYLVNIDYPEKFELGSSIDCSFLDHFLNSQ